MMLLSEAFVHAKETTWPCIHDDFFLHGGTLRTRWEAVNGNSLVVEDQAAIICRNEVRNPGSGRNANVERRDAAPSFPEV
jgi:hypothetical protein